jgi:hypothetical protein
VIFSDSYSVEVEVYKVIKQPRKMNMLIQINNVNIILLIFLTRYPDDLK